MKDRWKFCQNCYLNGHCENQDRGHKCEHYAKQLEDKVERLQELLSQEENRIRSLLERVGEADKIIKYYAEKHGKLKACDYLNKWGVK